MNTPPTHAACPCGSARPFDACCGPLLAGRVPADSAETLMRSRYSAYTCRDAAYLLHTWHTQTRPASMDFSDDDSEWLGLTILRREQGGERDSVGSVEFVARYRQRGVLRQLHERSRFARENRAWRYLEGDILPALQPGRNEPCWCGSGQKFKKCCG